jgi:hypothetical protein
VVMAAMRRRASVLAVVVDCIASCGSDCLLIIGLEESLLGCSWVINLSCACIGINQLADLDIGLTELLAFLRIDHTQARGHHLQIDVEGLEDDSFHPHQIFANNWYRCCKVDDIRIERTIASHHDIPQALCSCL